MYSFNLVLSVARCVRQRQTSSGYCFWTWFYAVVGAHSSPRIRRRPRNSNPYGLVRKKNWLWGRRWSDAFRIPRAPAPAFSQRSVALGVQSKWKGGGEGERLCEGGNGEWKAPSWSPGVDWLQQADVLYTRYIPTPRCVLQFKDGLPLL